LLNFGIAHYPPANTTVGVQGLAFESASRSSSWISTARSRTSSSRPWKNTLPPRAPFEQLAIDRALPNLPSRDVQYAERDTGTRNDAYGHVETSSPRANDWKFIAPAL
jgi:hypothetical protein